MGRYGLDMESLPRSDKFPVKSIISPLEFRS
jgi:hypothetical protein